MNRRRLVHLRGLGDSMTRQQAGEMVDLLQVLQCCGKVTYMLHALEWAWEAAKLQEDRKRIAREGLKWSTVLYGQDNKDKQKWKNMFNSCKGSHKMKRNNT